MNRREIFWKHVHAALDARLDPLEDIEVQRHIAEDPALLVDLSRLAMRLSGLERRTRVRRVAVLVTAAVLLLLALIVNWKPRPNPSSAPAVGDTGPSRVLALQTSITRIDADGSTTCSYDGVETTNTFVAHFPNQDRGGSAVLSFVTDIRSIRSEMYP